MPAASEHSEALSAKIQLGLARSLRSNLRVGSSHDLALVGWLMLALGCGFLAYISRMHEITHDAFHEMSLFREALVQGEFPTRDVFAYTPTVNPSVHHEWGTGAVLYFATIGSGLGVAGLSALKLLLIAALWLLLYRVARMRGAHPYVFACIAVATFPVFWVGFATVRAQLFTLVFIAAQLWMQELDWRGRRAWILLWLAMMVVWLNLHAGFLVGLGLIAFHGLERFGASLLRRRCLMGALADTWHLILAAPAAICILPLNPYGWQYIPFLVRAVSMPRPLVREWQPLWETYAPTLTLATFFVSVFLFVYAQRYNRLGRLKGAAFLALCIYMTLKHIRHGSIYGVVWLAYVPAWISRTPLGKNLVDLINQHRQAVVRISQAVALGSLMFATVHHFWRPSLPPKQLYSTACYPTGAVEYLKQNHFRGNLMTPFHVGAYVSWEMYPEVQVSLDGRYEVAYRDNVMPEHNQFYGGQENWWTILDKYPTDAVIVHRQAPVYEQLDVFRDDTQQPLRPKTRHPWRFVYEDDSFAVLATPACRLPTVNRMGEELADGAREAFSAAHAHWNRTPNRPLANRQTGTAEK